MRPSAPVACQRPTFLPTTEITERGSPNHAVTRRPLPAAVGPMRSSLSPARAPGQEFRTPRAPRDKRAPFHLRLGDSQCLGWRRQRARSSRCSSSHWRGHSQAAHTAPRLHFRRLSWAWVACVPVAAVRVYTGVRPRLASAPPHSPAPVLNISRAGSARPRAPPLARADCLFRWRLVYSVP